MIALTKGIREAFLTCLADDAIVFRPRAVEGQIEPLAQGIEQIRERIPAFLVLDHSKAVF